MVDSRSEVNAINLSFAKQLGLRIRLIDVGVHKIDSIMLDTHKIVVATFSVMDKANRIRLFEETFLIANVWPEVVLEMLFFTLSGVDVDFSGQKPRWRIYTTKEALLTTRHVELVGKNEFAVAAFDLKHKTFVVHVASLHSIPLDAKPQISGLIIEEAPTQVLAKYLDFADVFFLDLVSKFPEHTRINNHAIKLVDGQQPPYRPIYSLGPVELWTLKTYIKTNLANKFIRLL